MSTVIRSTCAHERADLAARSVVHLFPHPGRIGRRRVGDDPVDHVIERVAELAGEPGRIEPLE
jgi:hypothetical protein